MIEIDSEECGGAGRPQPDRDRPAWLGVGIDQSLMHTAIGQLLEKVRRTRGGQWDSLRIDPTLEALRSFAPNPDRPSRTTDGDRIKDGRLEQDACRLLPDLTPGSPHHPGNRQSSLTVGDHQNLACKLTLYPIQGLESLFGAGTPHDNPLFHQIGVKWMQRMTEFEHHVVRHIDHIGQRPHSGLHQPMLQVKGRGADRNGAH